MTTVLVPRSLIASLRLWWRLAPFGPVIVLAAATDPVAITPAAAPKTHVLFMGADITVEKDKVYHAVEDVTPSDLVIRPGGQPVKMPLAAAADLRINESLKLAASSVEIEHLKAERAYSINADPFIQLSKAASFAAGESQNADIANSNALLARMLGGAGGGANTGADAAEAHSLALQNTLQPEIFDVGSQSVKAGNAAAEEMYDAIRMSFEVTSKTDVGHPYYAVIAQIRDRDSKPGQVRKWAYVKSLGSMAAGDTRRVLVYRSGMPPGYILESCEVHLYNGREELATNLSRKRVSLTDEEAFDFRVIEYIGANKGRTLPAAPMTTALSTEVRARLTPAQFHEISYVSVGKNGRVIAVFRDAGGTQPLGDPVLESVLKKIPFKPALTAGKPLDSLVPIELGRFTTP